MVEVEPEVQQSLSRKARQQRAYEYLCRYEGQEIQLDSFAEYCAWKPDTAKTHISKRLQGILIHQKEGIYLVQGVTAYTEEQFLGLLSQVRGSGPILITEQLEPTALVEADPFHTRTLERIFKRDSADSERLNSTEAFDIEYKTSFNWLNRPEYTKTMAALSNARGGYIIFGVQDSKKTVGLQNSHFENIKIHKVTEDLNEFFSPEIRWKCHLYREETSGLSFGLIYVWEAEKKPVISLKNDGQDVKAAEIYYRYSGRSEKVRYPELRALIDAENLKERLLWMKHIEKIKDVGPENVGVFDINTGIVTGPSGSFLISEDVLPKLKFIREGHFTETEAAPAIRLIGDAEVITDKSILPFRTRALHSDDILEAFFNQSELIDPLEYVDQICSEPSPYLPVYFFINMAQISIEDVITRLEELKIRQPSRKKLISRLKEDNNLLDTGLLTTGTLAAKAKMQYKLQIITKALPENLVDESNDNLKYFLQAITHVSKDEIDFNYLLPLLKQLFDKYYSRADGTLVHWLRKALCYMDKLQFG